MTTTNIPAVLVSLRISIFPNTRNDKKMTKEIQNVRKLGAKSGRWTRYKLDPQIFEPISEFCSQVRKFHYDHTLPWMDGSQLLTEKMRKKYDIYMEESKITFQALVDQFKDRYPDAICCKYCKKNPPNGIERRECCAVGMHGKDFNADDYPVNIADEFAIDVEHSPVPESKHFAPEFAKAYGSEINHGNDKRIDLAVQESVQRLLKPVRHIVEKLTGKEQVFRDSLIDNVNEVLAEIPAFDFTGNEKIAKAVTAIRKSISNVNPQTLRESKVVRKETAEAARKILSTFGNIGGRKLAME